ncbi:MAG: fumarylacetoacetase [Adhaeribacter sp.]|nr:fumarylacetoacetase [Adhaeribacter sp.]
MIRANDPHLHSWIQISPTSDFPIQNLPFGIFSTATRDPRMGVAIGEYILDLYAVAQEGLFDLLSLEDPTIFHTPTLNPFIALGKPVWREVRERVSVLLRNDNPEIRDNDAVMKACLVKKQEATLHLPIKVANYTDFYSSLDHATNVGLMFRNPENPLLPNWKHMPVGYHGRASSIVVSGQPVFRPQGQTKAPETALPSFGPTNELDFELEVAFISGRATDMGSFVMTDEADDYIFGLVLFNDWSARDLQRWEHMPLGPFLGKSFASSISPWVVTLDALEPFRVPGPDQDPKVLPYLTYDGHKHLDINLKVYLQPAEDESLLICQSNTKYLYWNMNQQLAHQTSNGCNLEVGDLYASGTISGSDPDTYGSMLEVTWQGSKPITLPNGTTRQFLNDGDTIIMKGYAERNSIRVGFGELRNKVFPTL